MVDEEVSVDETASVQVHFKRFPPLLEGEKIEKR
jgi:hypothetical protein